MTAACTQESSSWISPTLKWKQPCLLTEGWKPHVGNPRNPENLFCYWDASLRSADLGVGWFLQAEQVRCPPCRRANPSVSRDPGRTWARSLWATAPHSRLSGPMAGAQTHHQEEGKPRHSKPSPPPFQLMLEMPPSAPESCCPAAPRQGHTLDVFPMGNQETAYFCKLPQPATSPVTVIHQFLDSWSKIPARIIYSLLKVQSLSSFSVTRYKYLAWIHLSSRSTSLVQRNRKDRRAPWLPVDSKYRTASAGAGSWPPEVKSEVTSVTFQRTPISTMLDLYRINVCQFSKVGLSTPTELRVSEVPAGHSWALLQRLFSFPNMITLGDGCQSSSPFSPIQWRT